MSAALDRFRLEPPDVVTTDEEHAALSWAWDVCHDLGDHGGMAFMVEAKATAERPLPADLSGTTIFIASTASPNRAMDVVKQDWNLKPFRANPIILDNHDHGRIVGVAVSAEVSKEGRDAGSLVIEVDWDEGSTDPTIVEVGRQHLQGIRRAGSVGFMPHKQTARSALPKGHWAYQEPVEVQTWWGGTEMVSGWLMEKNELLEFSSATVPMNAEAVQRQFFARGKAKGRSVEDDAASLVVRLAQGTREQHDAVMDVLFPLFIERARKSAEMRRLVHAWTELGAPSAKLSEPDLYELVAQFVSKEPR